MAFGSRLRKRPAAAAIGLAGLAVANGTTFNGTATLGLYVYAEEGNDFWMSTAVAAILGLKHCNDRNDKILAAISAESLGNCPGMNFSYTLHNSEGSPSLAVSDFLLQSETTDLIIGAAFSSVSIPLSTVANVKKVPSISCSSTSPQLSDRISGTSLFTRTIPSDTETAQVLCLLIESLDVDNVGLLFVDDGYGLGYRDALTASCAARSIGVHATSFEPTNEMSLTFAIDFIKERRLNIIVVVAFDDALTPMMSQFKSRGLAGAGRLLIFSDGITTNGVQDYLKANNDSKSFEVFEHAVRIQADGGNPSQEFSRFRKAWRSVSEEELNFINAALPRPTLRVNRSFFERTARFLEFAPFAYDAVALGCRAVCNSINVSAGETPTPGSTDGNEVYSAILKDRFAGSSGKIDIEASTGTRALSSAVFMTSAFLFDTSDDGTLLSVRTTAVGIFNDARWAVKFNFPEVPPSVSFSTEFNYLSSGLKITSVVLSSLLIGCCFFLIVYTWRKRYTRIFSRAQPTILILFLVGIILSTMSTFFLGLEDLNSEYFSQEFLDFSCMAFYYFWTIGTAMTFGALVAKLYRIWRIFSNRALRRIKITNRDLYIFIAAICSLDVIVLILWTVLSPMSYQRVPLREDIYGNVLESFGDCVSENSVPFLVFLISYQIILFVAGVIFSYKVRKADSDYQESQWITISLVSQCQMFLLGVPLIFVFGPENTESRFLVMFFVIWLNNILLVAVLYIPKIRAVVKNVKRAGSANSETSYPNRQSFAVNANDVLLEEFSSGAGGGASPTIRRLNQSPPTSVLDLLSLRRSTSSRLFIAGREASTQWNADDSERAALLLSGFTGQTTNSPTGILHCSTTATSVKEQTLGTISVSRSIRDMSVVDEEGEEERGERANSSECIGDAIQPDSDSSSTTCETSRPEDSGAPSSMGRTSVDAQTTMSLA